MNTRHRLLIAACVIGIFTSGFATGWLIKERRVETIITSPPGGRTSGKPASEVLAHMRQQLQLTPEQDLAITGLLEDWEKQATQIDERRLGEKTNLFRELTPRLREHLTAQQREIFDRVVRQTLKRQNTQRP